MFQCIWTALEDIDIVLRGQQVGEHTANPFFVVDDHNAASMNRCDFLEVCGAFGYRFSDAKVHFTCASPASHGAVHGGQSQSRANRHLGRKEWLERPSARRLLHTDPVIADGELDGVRNESCPDADGPSSEQCLDGMAMVMPLDSGPSFQHGLADSIALSTTGPMRTESVSSFSPRTA